MREAKTPDDWKIIVEAAEKQGYTTTASYIRARLVPLAKKDKR